ncbi:MAG: dissimilatory-type sulfite reductase subunit alpha [Deltaproteobacteria bacterium]|nr:dissimilatory-type sulfite reductase subunit alpha [Deltaproteobacteria bacterium]
MADEKATPLLDELEKGPYPSFVREIKLAAKNNKMAAGVLHQLEKSYRDKIGYWKHGGIVGVMGYGGGVIGRYSALPDDFPEVAHFHTLRVNQPAGWFYTADVLRKICDMWDKHGSGLTNMHGSTGDMVLLGTRTEELESVFGELTKMGFDLGGSGSDVRTPSCCVGPARCEWACFDTLKTCYEITQHYQDELHRPAFPYKYKFKFAGCANDCVAAIARSDMSFIGTWKDDIQQDDEEIKNYAKAGLDIQSDVVENCPGKCMTWDPDNMKLTIDNSYCLKCMHCINVLPKALRPGKQRGVTILLGAKAPIVEGALLSSVLIPFYDIDNEGLDDLFELVEDGIWDVWTENGKNRERVGEFIQRVGMGNFLESIGLEPDPHMISHPRDNPYIFFDQEDEEEEA